MRQLYFVCCINELDSVPDEKLRSISMKLVEKLESVAESEEV